MARPLRPIVSDRPTVAAVAGFMRSKRHTSHQTLHEISELTHYSVSTISEATSGRRLPRWELARAFVEACGGSPDDIAELGRLWKAAAAELNASERPQPVGDALLITAARDPQPEAGQPGEPGHAPMEEPAPAGGAVPGFKRRGPGLREALHQALPPGIAAEPSETGPDAAAFSAPPHSSSALRPPQQDDLREHAELVKAMVTERAQRTETTLSRTMLMIALCVLLAAVAITIPGVTIAVALGAIHASPPEVVTSVLATEAIAMKFFTTVIRLLWDRAADVRHEGRSK